MFNIAFLTTTKLNIMNESYARLLKAAFELKGLENPAQLADALNTYDQVVQNWKTRGVPSSMLTAIEEKIGALPLWITTGRGDMSANKLFQLKLSAAQKNALSILEEIGEDGGEVWLKMGKMIADLRSGDRRHENVGFDPDRRLGGYVLNDEQDSSRFNPISEKEKESEKLPKGKKT
jgi:hypothetical protein